MKLPFFLQNNNNSISDYVLSANPHYYDYFHYLRFREDDTVELFHGSGQVIRTTATGKYSISEIDAMTAVIKFYDMIEAHPYQDDEHVADVEPFEIKVTKEKGIFPFRTEVPGEIDDEDEWPCLLFNERYTFESDPLVSIWSNRIENSYYLLMIHKSDDSQRQYYFYDGCQKLKAKDLFTLGIPKEEFW